jgi:hypothetical protein
MSNNGINKWVLFNQEKMKYFTPDIWAGWQSNDDAVVCRAHQKWKQNLAAYRRHIHKLAPSLGAIGRFFIDHSLHDGHLLSFHVTDYPLKNLNRRPRRHESAVMISVLGWINNIPYIYGLQYKDILDLSITTKNDLFSEPSSRFGDWGYDELLRHGKEAFRHNILFATGTEISIAFKRFNFKRWKRSNQRIQRLVNTLRNLPNADL